MKIFKWNEEKNQQLKLERKICFEEVVAALDKGRLLARVKHPNSEKYTDQVVLYVEINHYAYVVPTVETEDHIFLKTIFPSRKITKQYLTKERSSHERST